MFITAALIWYVIFGFQNNLDRRLNMPMLKTAAANAGWGVFLIVFLLSYEKALKRLFS